MLEILTNLDANILLYIQNFIRNDILTPFFTVITTLGNAGAIWIVVSLVLLFNKNTREIGIMSICALLLSLIVNNLIIKNIVARTRPYEAIEALIPLVKRPSDYSFPSGHSASSFASAGIFVKNLPKPIGVPLLVLAVLIALSRLYVGVHYPSDVIVGMISGILISYLAEMLILKIFSVRERVSD